MEVDGVIYQRHEPGIVRYFTLCGAVDIERWTYREMGVRNGPTLVPLDLDAGLVERTTPALGFRIALGYAKDHMRSCAEDMTADHRCPPSRSTLERVAKAIGTAATRVAPHRTAPAAGGAGAGRRRRHLTGPRPHVGAHGGGRPGRRDARDASQDAAYALHTQEASPGECQLPDGSMSARSASTTPTERRWPRAAAAHEFPTDRLVRPMMADLRHALRQVPALAVGVIQDGAPELWNLLRPPSWPNRWSRPATKRSTGIISPSGSPTSYGTGSPTRPLAGRGCLGGTSLDGTDHAIYRIRAWVRDRYADALARSDRRLLKQLAPHLTYLENNADLMHYARLRAVGLPVGSGVTEGACKSVIKMRTNGSSQRWRPTGLEAVLTLRST